MLESFETVEYCKARQTMPSIHRCSFSFSFFSSFFMHVKLQAIPISSNWNPNCIPREETTRTVSSHQLGGFMRPRTNMQKNLLLHLNLLFENLAQLDPLTLHPRLHKLRFQTALLHATWPFDTPFHPPSYVWVSRVRRAPLP